AAGHRADRARKLRRPAAIRAGRARVRVFRTQVSQGGRARLPIEAAADVLRRGAEPGPERAIEVRNIGKARGRGDVADLRPFAFRLAQQAMGQQQTLLEDEAREGGSGQLEQMLDVARTEAVTGGNVRKPKLRSPEARQHLGLHSVEASCREAATLRP